LIYPILRDVRNIILDKPVTEDICNLYIYLMIKQHAVLANCTMFAFLRIFRRDGAV